jgi:hypothetical protein
MNPILAKEWHPTKNGSLTPKDVKPGSSKKVWWLCKKDNTHEWEAIIYSRTYGRGCPFCFGRAINAKNNLLAVNPELAKEWHPKKNKLLTPNIVLPKSHKKVWWLCKNDSSHEWEAVISSRKAGSGCPYCNGKAVNTQNCLLTLQPELAKEWHPTKNGSLKSTDVTPRSNKKVWWLCKKDNTHEWKTAICNRTGGSGCPYCAGKAVNIQNCLLTKRPDISQEWHPTKNDSLTPNDVTPGSGKIVWWLCKKDSTHEWRTSVLSRNQGSGCPFCHSSTSEPELRIYTELKSIFPEVEHRKRINQIECDIYIPELNAAIEIDGFYWHKGKYDSDRNKNIKLEKIGITLIRARDMGLSRISSLDVVYSLESSSFKLIAEILSSINKLETVSNSIKTRIDNYLEEGLFQNESEYVRLLNMLPSALPGTSLLDKLPKLAKEWHPTKNGSLKANDVTPGSRKKVWWLCNKDNTHEWRTAISDRAVGNGCPFCSGKAVNIQNCLFTVHPIIASEWHPTKNGTLTPKDVTSFSHKKVWWVCKNNYKHEWESAVSQRARKHGCPYCSGRVANLENCLFTVYPIIASEWHPTKNGKLSPRDIKPWSHKKVWWLCKTDNTHEWEAVVSSRMAGSGCPYCSGRVANLENCLFTNKPKLAHEWHPTKNGKLSPRDIKPWSHKKVWWLCKTDNTQKLVIGQRETTVLTVQEGQRISKTVYSPIGQKLLWNGIQPRMVHCRRRMSNPCRAKKCGGYVEK